jgi:hypothetical protein
MEIGTMVKITEEPWNQFAGELVIVTKIDDDGIGFDFVIPERRGHAPMKSAIASYGQFDLEKLGIKI